LTMLHCRQPVRITLRSTQTDGLLLQLFLCLLPASTVGVQLPQTTPSLFIAATEAGNGSLPLTDGASPGWVQNRLKLPHKKAMIVAMLLGDLVEAERRLQGPARCLVHDTHLC